MKKLFLLLLFCIGSPAMTITEMLRKSVALKEEQLEYINQQFRVHTSDGSIPILRHNLCSDLRKLSDTQVKALLSKGDALLYLKKKIDDSYHLELQGKLKGGAGAIFCACVNMAVRVGCWAGIFAGVGGVVAAGAATSGPFGAAAAGVAANAAIATTTVGTATGFVAVASAIEATALKATLWAALLPIPIP